jgi:very-short-patch-repair endonuclease
MTYEGDASPELADVLSRHDGVLSVDSAMKYLTRDALRWRVGSGRWQQPCRGIVVAQSGPLTEFQALRIAVLWAGWLDAVWRTARLVVEVDGRHHMDAAQYWADMDRDNDLTVDGYRVLRFPAFLVRYHPGYVARKIRAALRPGVGDPDPGLIRTG